MPFPLIRTYRLMTLNLNLHCLSKVSVCRNKSMMILYLDKTCLGSIHYRSNNPSYSFSDTDECADDLSLCGMFGSCINTNGSYKCDCEIGYSGNHCKEGNGMTEIDTSTHAF